MIAPAKLSAAYYEHFGSKFKNGHSLANLLLQL
jgi:hypothetical protein